jgi:pimeloyl-ACP methyl ester carboxylesterase
MHVATAPDGAKIAYHLDSSVPPGRSPRGTVLMHHGLGLNGHAWRQWLPPLLDAGFQVIRVDMRGHGRSDKPEPGFPWSTARLCGDVDAVLDREGVSQCHFVGESWGGTLGLAWAIANPDRASTVTVMSTTYDGGLVPKLDTFAPMIRDQGIEAWSAMMVPARFMPEFDEEIQRWVERTQSECVPHVIADMSDYIIGETLQDSLPSLRAPVLILAAQGSPFVKPEMAVALLQRLPDAELHRYPGHRHGLVLSGAEIGAAELTAFILRRG